LLRGIIVKVRIRENSHYFTNLLSYEERERERERSG